MKSIVFLVSGGGGNLKFLYLAINYGLVDNLKLYVIADRDCEAVEFAKKSNIKARVIDYNKKNPLQLRHSLREIDPDIIITSWNKIIDPDTVHEFYGKLINLHYSLLPAFSGMMGMNPVIKAYEQGCKYIGTTCHIVDEGVDTGRIVSQSVFSTERPLDDSITIMFRKGCLTLLTGIQEVLHSDPILVKSDFAEENVLPKSFFDSRFMEEWFWEGVSKL